ncbi:MAG: hypothetical protein HC938_16360, partial [Nitrospira sp.]|nr:hypothetical protein [Nitrospira sp.]
MKYSNGSWVWSSVIVGFLFTLLEPAGAWAGKLEDVLLENKQITVDQWVQIKAEEERREAKAMEQSRGIGDTPV